MSASLAYLLDINILSDLVRNPQGAIAAQVTKAGEDTVCTSSIMARAHENQHACSSRSHSRAKVAPASEFRGNVGSI